MITPLFRASRRSAATEASRGISSPGEPQRFLDSTPLRSVPLGMTRWAMGKEWTLAENEAQGEGMLPDGRHRLEKRHFERAQRVEKSHTPIARGSSTPLRSVSLGMTEWVIGKEWTLAENEAQGEGMLPDGRHRLEKRHFERAEGAQRLKRVEKSPPAAARDSSTSLRFAPFRSE